MDNRKQLTLYVGEEQLERWNEYQDELHFSSRAEMIRRAVEFFHSVQSNQGEDDLMYEEILGEIDDLKDQVEIAISRIGNVREEQISQDNIQSFAQETAFHMDTSKGSIDGLVENIKEKGDYIRMHHAQVVIQDEDQPEFGDDTIVMEAEELREVDPTFRAGLREAWNQVDDAEEIFGIEILSEEEAVAHGI